MYHSVDFEFQNEDIDLTPDMSKVWGSVLKGLRESDESMVYAACSELKNIEYTSDTIEIYCNDDALYNLLKKYKGTIEKFAGKGCVNIYQKRATVKCNKQLINGLAKIFGDKLIIK